VLDASRCTKEYPHGQPVPCPACGKTKTTAPIGLIDDELETDFAALIPDPVLTRAINALTAAATTGAGFIYLFGGHGTGKTHLLQATVNLAVQHSHTAEYTKSTALLNTLRDGFRQNDEAGYDQRYQQLIARPVLAIDEIERFAGTNYALQTISDLIDERYRRRRRHLTVIASNMPPTKMPPAIADRLAQAEHYLLNGPSWRQVLREVQP
jgi:DNA replication protein DnaC